MVNVHLISVPIPDNKDSLKSMKRNEWRMVEHIQRNGTEVYSSSKSVLLFYKSWLVQTAETLLQIPFILVGLSSYADSQMIKLPCMSSIRDDYYHPITHAVVKVHPFASRFTASEGAILPQIYHSNIRLDAHFSGLRYYMYYYPLPTGIIFTLGLALYLFVCGIALYYFFIIRKDIFAYNGNEPTPTEEKPPRRTLPPAKQVNLPTPPPEDRPGKQVSDDEEYEAKHSFDVDTSTESDSDIEVIESPVTAIQGPPSSGIPSSVSAQSAVSDPSNTALTSAVSSSSAEQTDIVTVTDSSIPSARTEQGDLLATAASEIHDGIVTNVTSSSVSEISSAESSSSDAEMKTPLSKDVGRNDTA